MKSSSNGLKEYEILTEHTDNIDWQNARTQLTESHTDSLTTWVIVDFDICILTSTEGCLWSKI